MPTDSGPTPALPCACASLRRAARAVTQLYDDAIRSSGLRVTQFTLLQVLGRRGELTQSELGNLLALDSTTLSRTLRPLEASKWIRSRAGEDRRERHWSITSAGQRKLDAAVPAWESSQARLHRRIGDEQWQRILSDLAAIAASARAI
ncbi:MAG TPA: MarR family winged helix-turn-helix transcriptional regulator [Gemmatimonadaceae bacterium]|nr:MarR family winged helix-turn-helix transcriptional regulator [Gemmatimonadaceae bacterium]